MKQQDITKLSIDDLKGKVESFSDQMIKMKITNGVSPIENPLQIRHIRKTIARLKTELTKREAQA